MTSKVLNRRAGFPRLPVFTSKHDFEESMKRKVNTTMERSHVESKLDALKKGHANVLIKIQEAQKAVEKFMADRLATEGAIQILEILLREQAQADKDSGPEEGAIIPMTPTE